MKKGLEYSKVLESAGLTREQAEIHLKVIEGAMKDNVATKHDLAELRSEFKFEAQDIRNEVRLVEQRLINKTGLMLLTSTTTLAALVTVLKFVF